MLMIGKKSETVDAAKSVASTATSDDKEGDYFFSYWN